MNYDYYKATEEDRSRARELSGRLDIPYGEAVARLRKMETIRLIETAETLEHLREALLQTAVYAVWTGSDV